MLARRVDRIVVRGFKSIGSAELSFGDLTVLIGANGAGKSNCASLLRLFRAMAQDKLRSFVERSGGASALLRYGPKNTPSIRCGIELTSQYGPLSYVFGLSYAADDRLSLADVEVLVNSKLDPASVDDLSVGEGLSDSTFLGLAGPDDDYLDVTIRETLRGIQVYHFHDTTSEARIRQNGDLNDNRTLHEDGRNLAAFLYKLRQTKPEFLQLIVRHVRLAAPFFDTFVLTPNALNQHTIMLRWRESGSDEEFGVHALSDGTLRFITLAALLLQPPEDLPPVAFIDEPELGLHPYAIAVLASLLRQASRHCQIMVATQSPTLLDQFEPQDVIVVDRVNGATEFHRKSPEELAEWLEEYTLSELWSKNVLGGSPSR